MKFLRTEYAALIGILLILLATVKHAFEVYTSVMYMDSDPDIWQKVYIAIMLIAIDFAVLLFTIHGNNYAAQTFAFMIFLVNLYAFWHPISLPKWGIEWFIYFPGFLFSAMFAYGLYYFTDLFSDLLLKSNKLGELREELEESKIQISSLEVEIKNQQTEFSQLQEEKEKLLKQIFQTEENGVDVNKVVEKAGHFDLLIQYVIESEGYLEKSPEALRKGVEYWTKKQEEGNLDMKNMVKLLSYKKAYLTLTGNGVATTPV